jgi:patatin-like phospholipase/acyl hydrolase
MAGGGVRGIISTKFLIEVEKITNKRIYELFDYYGGSSIGCLITTGILLSTNGVVPKYTAEELHQILLNNISNCFHWTYKSYILSFFGLLGSAYTNIGLTNAVKVCCEEYKIKNLLKPIIFPSYDKLTNRNYYFDYYKDQDVLLSDAVLACTAAPTYFDSHEVTINDKNYNLIDSGIVSNSATNLVLLEVLKHNHVKKSDILLLNIGTGMFTLPTATYNGLLSWAPNIVNSFMNAAMENELYELSLLLPQQNYYKLDVPLDIKYYQMDNISKDAIDYYLSETGKWIKNNYSDIEVFCDKLMKNKGYIKDI